MPGPQCVTPGCRGVTLIDDLCAKCYNAKQIARSTGKRKRRTRSKPKGNCTWKGCDRPLFASGLCAGHYKRRRAGQDMDPPIRVRTKPKSVNNSKPGHDRPMTERRCISCPNMFMSEGAHHRMCGSCRSRSDDMTEHEIHI